MFIKTILQKLIYLVYTYYDNKAEIIKLTDLGNEIIKMYKKKLNDSNFITNIDEITLSENDEYIKFYKIFHSSIIDNLDNIIQPMDIFSNLYLNPKLKKIISEILIYIKKENNHETDELIFGYKKYLYTLKDYLYLDLSMDDINNNINKWKEGFFSKPEDSVKLFKNTVLELFTNITKNMENEIAQSEIILGEIENKQQEEEILDNIKYKLKKFFDPSDKLNTGFENLNHLLLGGLDKTRLYTIAGRPGVGKSIFALHIFHHIATLFEKQNKEIDMLNKKNINNKNDSDSNTDLLNITGKKKKYAFYITLENSYEETLFRLISSYNKIDSYDLKELLEGKIPYNFKIKNPSYRNLSKKQEEELSNKILNDKIEKILNLPIQIAYFPSGTITVADLFNFINTKSQSLGIKPGLIIVDYLNLLKSENSTETRHMLTDITTKLKNMAVQFKCPVITLTQLTKSSYDKGSYLDAPTLGDIKEASGIIDNSDLIGFLTGYSFSELRILFSNKKNIEKYKMLYDKFISAESFSISNKNKYSKDFKPNSSKLVTFYIRKNRAALEGSCDFIFYGNLLYFTELSNIITDNSQYQPNINNEYNDINNIDENNTYDSNELSLTANQTINNEMLEDEDFY